MKPSTCASLAPILLLAACRSGTVEPPPPVEPPRTASVEQPAATQPGAAASQPTAEAPRPRTVAEAVPFVLAKLSDADKQKIKETPKKDLILFHHGLGTGIRNQTGLWQGNAALLEDCGKPHPDDCSMLIIEALWEELNRAPE